ncbi:MAG: NUMOD1 domain-containing DNA-binding protein [Intestinibacter sp.]
MPPVYKKLIYQYSLEGKFIKEWNSIREAAIEFGCSDSSIGRAVLDGTPSMKYFWADYKKEYLNIDNFKINGNKIVTYLYTYDGKFL